jgi:diacylglycerol kinase (ATP)
MPTLLVVNPSSGAGRATRRLAAILPRLLSAYPDLWILPSRSSEHVTDLVSAAIDRGDRRVLIAGGDGTVHFAARAAAGTGCALGILPVGTGNDVARAIGVPSDLHGAAEIAVRGELRRIDLGLTAGKTFCCVLGVGLDTDALRTIRGSPFRRGRLLYALAALQGGSPSPPSPTPGPTPEACGSPRTPTWRTESSICVCCRT